MESVDVEVGFAAERESEDVEVNFEADDNASKDVQLEVKIKPEDVEVLVIEKHDGGVCYICSKKFSKESSLRRHEKIHTRLKRYPCTLCEKIFASSSNVKAHEVQVHSGLKNHLCTSCGKAFSRSDSLIKHRLTHTKEMPYNCPNCARAFSQSSHLKEHYYLHAEEKLFICEMCSKAFYQPRALRRHRLVHIPVKPFKCEKCDYSGNRASQLATHHKRKHSNGKVFSRLGHFNSEVTSPDLGNSFANDEEEATIEDEFADYEFNNSDPTEESPSQDKSVGGEPW